MCVGVWVFAHVCVCVYVSAHVGACAGVCWCICFCVFPPSTQIPLLMKKDEIFDLLCEHGVPMSRATWFIKVRGGWSTLVLWEGVGG